MQPQHGAGRRRLRGRARPVVGVVENDDDVELPAGAGKPGLFGKRAEKRRQALLLVACGTATIGR
jgi:hypothetical protein